MLSVLVVACALQATTGEFQFPTYPIGPVATALGRSGVALSTDAEAGLNPAALIDAPRGSVHRFEGFADYGGTMVGGRVDLLRRYALGASARRFDWGQVVEDDLGPGTAGLDASETQLVVGLATRVGPAIRLGVSIAWMTVDVFGVGTSATAFSLGAIVVPADRWSVAVAVRNLGEPAQSPGSPYSYRLPTRLRIGAARVFGPAQRPLTVVLDSEGRIDGSLDLAIHGGLAWRVVPFVTLRAGYESSPSTDADHQRTASWSGGLGIVVGPLDFGLAARVGGPLHEPELVIGLDAFR